MDVDTCSKLLSVLQVSTTGEYYSFDPPERVIPVALLRLPDVSPPRPASFLNEKMATANFDAITIYNAE